MLLPAGAIAGAVAVAGLFLASVLCCAKKKAPAPTESAKTTAAATAKRAPSSGKSKAH